jgi:polyisoprenoid-binding protein YceI
MKFLASLIILLTSVFTFVDSPVPATVSISESTLTWKATKVTGEHFGKVPLADAKLDYANGKITGGSFEMDMTSLTVEDITDAGSNKKLTDHLKSDDFFSVAKFNKSTFVIKQAKTSNGKDYEITGDLTIKGITSPVTFPAKVDVAGKSVTATGTITFDRTKFDIKYRSGNYFENLADKLIYDDVTLDVKLVATI